MLFYKEALKSDEFEEKKATEFSNKIDKYKNAKFSRGILDNVKYDPHKASCRAVIA